MVKLFFPPPLWKSEVAEVALVMVLMQDEDDDAEGTQLAVVGRNNGAFISFSPSKF